MEKQKENSRITTNTLVGSVITHLLKLKYFCAGNIFNLLIRNSLYTIHLISFFKNCRYRVAQATDKCVLQCGLHYAPPGKILRVPGQNIIKTACITLNTYYSIDRPSN